jgi:hypothetical protein
MSSDKRFYKTHIDKTNKTSRFYLKDIASGAILQKNIATEVALRFNQRHDDIRKDVAIRPTT